MVDVRVSLLRYDQRGGVFTEKGGGVNKGFPRPIPPRHHKTEKNNSKRVASPFVSGRDLSRQL